MPPLPTEAAPLKVCRQCGSAATPPTDKGMFVHGVGAVGFQSCPGCGARWQYLFDANARRARPHRWAVAGAFSVLLVGLLTLAVAAAIAITRSPDTPERALFSKDAASAEYEKIVGPTNGAAFVLLARLKAPAPAPVAEIEPAVADFERLARASNAALEKVRWPDGTDADVEKLIAANRAFIKHVGLVHLGVVRDPAFIRKLDAVTATRRDAMNAVRRDLGLRPT